MSISVTSHNVKWVWNVAGLFMVNIEIKETHFCRSDLRIATKLTDSRELEFPTTTQNVLLILKFTIIYILNTNIYPIKHFTF